LGAPMVSHLRRFISSYRLMAKIRALEKYLHGKCVFYEQHLFARQHPYLPCSIFL
jgi:hypothetical protein